MPKTLKEMGAEVEQFCRDKGWYDEPVPFAQAMALLHEEAAEAGHAWREHGLEDVTRYYFTDAGFKTKIENPKPEGVGSEFADILIRMLDDDVRYDMLLEEYLEKDPEIFVLADDFLVNVNTLHFHISQVNFALETSGESPRSEFAVVLSFLRQFARQCGIDLDAEYEKKMRYNRTRAYRHGGRRA